MQAEFRRCLDQVDIEGIKKLWRHVSPHLPQPRDDNEALVTIHHARTQSNAMPLQKRFYSHRWLLDNGHVSGLPDHLKPSAERVYPRVCESVGISVNFRNPILKPIGDLVRGAMENAVLDAYADKKTEPEFLKARMNDAKQQAIRQLVGLKGY